MNFSSLLLVWTAVAAAAAAADHHYEYTASAPPTRKAALPFGHRKASVLDLRGGSDEKAETEAAPATSTADPSLASASASAPPPAAAAAAAAAGENMDSETVEDEISVEATDEDDQISGALDADAVNITADAFLHPAHLEGDNGDDKEDTAEEAFYSAVEDEDEGSTTPVMLDDDDVDTDRNSRVSETIAGPEEANESPAKGEIENLKIDDLVEADISGVEGQEETDDLKQQQGSGFTDDESAAYVDRLDLADDEGGDEELQTEVMPTDIGADDIENDVDPLDLNSEENRRDDILQRQKEATLAAASEAAAAARVAVAQDAPPSVQYMITRNMKRVLVDELGYTEEEVNSMKPDVAAVITSKRLKRPSSGMPDAFYVDGKAPKPTKNIFAKVMTSKIVRRVIVPAVIIGSTSFFAISLLRTDDDDESDNTPTVSFSSVNAAQLSAATVERAQQMTAKAADSDELMTPSVPEEELDESGLSALERDVPNLEDTWLDRFISRVLEKTPFRGK